MRVSIVVAVLGGTCGLIMSGCSAETPPNPSTQGGRPIPVPADGPEVVASDAGPAPTANRPVATPQQEDGDQASCGDGVVDTAGGETCDDGTPGGGKGCDAQCQVQPGYACPTEGGACVAARCGDGLLAGDEVCDDGNADAGDGCDGSCELERGFACPTPGQPCIPIECGDARIEGLEQCDDGNLEIGDGCTPFCQREPRCVNGVCESICGDNILGGSESCDDGNQGDGDGCSALCELEPGFECLSIRAEEPDRIYLPVVLRDFRGNDLGGGHVDFQNLLGDDIGVVAPMLVGSPGKPVLRNPAGSATISSDASFSQWYRNTPNVNLTLVDELELTRQGPGTYVFDNGNFFPVDGRGFNGLPNSDPMHEPARDGGHNFSFTSEVRYWFEYRGQEVLSFRGDDDVWVFINGHLVVDLGGVHSALDGSVRLSDRAAELGLSVGGIYEAVVFQAERHTSQSSYKLTLTNFLTARSECESICGDGIATLGEECDDGNNVDGDGCAADCTLESVNIL